MYMFGHRGVNTKIDTENTITVSDPDLYNIISSEKSATHELEIKINQKGFEMYTFTFG